MKTSSCLFALALILGSGQTHAESVPVTAENFAQAETSWNFTNWAKLGSDRKLVHLRDVSPTGSDAPTVRMNWDTLYSIRIVNVADDKTFTVHLPESDLYMSAHILDEDGFAPYYLIEKGKDHEVKVRTNYALIIFRTEILDRNSKESLKISHASQNKIKVTGMMEAAYKAPDFDQTQLTALRKRYKQEFLDKGDDFTYAKGPGRVDQHVLNLSHAAGWGGMEPELHVSNAYFSSETMSGNVPRSITFEDPKNRFFTSFTLYDRDGYLMKGETHINSKMWKSNQDGTITIHFNAGKDTINNLSSDGKPFNYTIRNYGVSKTVLEGDWKPLKPRVPPKQMKMSTKIPAGIATPDILKTSIGTLTSFDGVPDKKTTQIVYDNLDLQRAQHAYLSSIQISSMYAMEQGLRKFGPPNKTALLFEELMDSKALWLTPNTVSVYMACWMELEGEPMVLETPPNVLGFINNAWFKYVVDFGNAGPDKGKGGKFLIVPHAYKGDIPDGYHVAKTYTKGHWVIWRGFQVNGSTKPAVDATKKSFRIYPLSQKENPPAMTFKNVSKISHNTIHRMDFGFWEELNSQIQDENLEGLDSDIRGLLATLGIEKGKKFAPDARMKKILTDAAAISSVTARALTARPRDQRHYLYTGERKWTNPFVKGRYDFLLNGETLFDSRVYMHFYATGITPAMAIKNVGKGSQYAIAYLDKNGKALDGSRTYKIHLPANVPAKDFWSFTLYDNQTRSMLQTDQRFPGLDNKKKGLQQNPDGSYDIFISPKPPKVKVGNWIQSVPGKGWNTIFRLYGPLESFYDKSWKPGDPELVQ